MTPSGTAALGPAAGFSPVRYTRRASRTFTRSRTRLRDLVLDVYTALLTAGTIGALAVGLVLALREQVARAWATGAGARTLVDAPWLSVPDGAASAVLMFAALLAVLALGRKLGPAAVTAAEGYWWLSLPLQRRPLLTGRLLRRLALGWAAGTLLYLPYGIITDLGATAAGQALGALTFGTATAGALLLAALRQTWLPGPGAGAGSGSVTRSGTRSGTGAGSAAPSASWPLAAASLLLLAGFSVLPRMAAAGAAWPPAVAGAAVVGIWLLLWPRLGRIPGSELRRGGAVSGHAGGALFLFDPAEIGRALAREGVAGRSARGRGWYARPAGSPFTALLRADAVAFVRTPGLWARPMLLLILGVSVLVTGGLQSTPLQLAVVALTVCVAVPAFGALARQTAITPGLDLLLPLSPGAVRLSRLTLPAAALALWTAVFCTALVLLGAGSPMLIVLGALAGVGLGASAVRGAYRPPSDWSAPPVETPFGSVPSAQAGAMFQGLDTALVSLLPLLLGLFLGYVPPALLLAQAAVSGVCVLMAMYSGARK